MKYSDKVYLESHSQAPPLLSVPQESKCNDDSPIRIKDR